MQRMSKLLLCFVFVFGIFASLNLTVFADTIAEKQQRAEVVKQTITELETELSLCESNKILAHDMAENARALGMSEEDEVIVRAKEIWASNNIRVSEINTELGNLRIELQDLEVYSNMTYAGNFKLTGYCACYSCCGKSPSSP